MLSGAFVAEAAARPICAAVLPGSPGAPSLPGGPTHLPAGRALAQKVPQQRGVVARAAVLQQEQQGAQRQATTQDLI